MNQEGTKRKLVALLSADVKEYSRLMSQDERGTIRTLTAYKEAMSSLIEEYKGRVVDAPGDNLLAEFGSVVDAVNCAVEIQRELAERNAELPYSRRMEFRIGINLGDIVVEEKKIYGDGVNIAARVESLAEGGGICISGTAYDHVENKLGLEYECLGEQEVKNIPKPVRVYRVLSYPGAAAHRVVRAKKALGKTWRNVVVVIVAVLVVVAAVALWIRLSAPPAKVSPVEKIALGLPDKPSIAVLPFVNLSEDPKQEYIADGISENIITSLSKISDLLVIARNSTFTYKGKPVKVQQVSKELGVRYVVEGSVQKADNQVRVTAQLVDATTGHHLWAERYDATMGDVFALQDKITQKIVTALALKLTPGEQEQVASKDTDNIEAYRAFTQGWQHYLRLTPDDLVRAISYFEKAIELDPIYWKAYAALAVTYWKGSQLAEFCKGLGITYYAGRLKPRQYLKMAMKKPSSLAHLVASEMNLLRRQYEQAIGEAKRAIALDPNDPSCHESFGWTLIMAGRPSEAVDFIKKGMRLDPHNPARYLYLLGLAHFAMGQLEEAVTSIQKALRLNPERLEMATPLAAAYAHLGLDKRARAALDNYRKGWFTPLTLREVMYFYPFKDPEVVDRFAEGLLKAGLPGQPSGYYKISEEKKLTGEEIRELVFGKETTGINPWTEHQWWMDCTKDGKAIHRDSPVHAEHWQQASPSDVVIHSMFKTIMADEQMEVLSDSGKVWIEDDMLYSQWGRVYEGLEYCATVFRNPQATPEERDEYLMITDFGFLPMSPGD
jgi:TolB-like protein/class 3 adenylate cyclase/Flp pilus assembly protein TadD